MFSHRNCAVNIGEFPRSACSPLNPYVSKRQYQCLFACWCYRHMCRKEHWGGYFVLIFCKENGHIGIFRGNEFQYLTFPSTCFIQWIRALLHTYWKGKAHKLLSSLLSKNCSRNAGRGDEGEWWRVWIKIQCIWYMVRTFVNVTIYPHPEQQ
jgi:hypothetical protein